MIIDIGRISHEICPRHPDITEISNLWNKFVGDYDLVYRLSSGELDNKILGIATIWIEDGILQMGGVVGPILPISETEIIKPFGAFAGETMFYDPVTGEISHQKIVYVRHLD